MGPGSRAARSAGTTTVFSDAVETGASPEFIFRSALHGFRARGLRPRPGMTEMLPPGADDGELRLGGGLRASGRRVEAALVGERLEAVGEADHGLGRAQHQIALAVEAARQAFEYADLGVVIEIDQHVAAEHQVEHAELAEVLQQVERLELDHGADVGGDLPAFADLREILDQQLDRQPALHLELAVEAGLGLLQHLGREIGGEDVETPSRQRLVELLEAHRQRIGLLAGRSGGAPDADALLRRARRHQSRHDGVAEMLERNLVAEEERLVGHHRLDHLDHEGLGVRSPQTLHQLGQAAKPGLARQRQKPALDQILLVGRQHEPGPLPQQFSKMIVVERRHDRLPEKRRTTFGAIWSSGSTDEHRPALVTDPGMPQMTLDASSCAITAPPAATMEPAPRVPSEPMPVSTTARHLAPHTSAADENMGSTEGLQKLTSAPSSSAICGSPALRTTRMWRPPGAI